VEKVWVHYIFKKGTICALIFLIDWRDLARLFLSTCEKHALMRLYAQGP
jgi:hypothetical protein